MRRPDAAGGGCASTASCSHRLSACVGSLRFHNASAASTACISLSRPCPVIAETGTSAHAFDLRQQPGAFLAQLGEALVALADQIPFVDGDDERAPLLLDQIGDLQILLLERLLRIERQHHDLGKADRLQRIADRKLLGLALRRASCA